MSTTKDTLHGTGDATVAKERLTYPQDWPAYNAAQVNEKEMVAALLRDLCDAIETPPQGRGRPRLPLSDVIFAAVTKVYGTMSGRRSMTDLRDFEARGYMAKAPSYNSIFDYLDNPVLTPLLRAMIEESSRPVREVETDFVVDSTGFSTSVHKRWFDAKYGRVQSVTEYVKAHAMVGVKTNIVTRAEATPGNINDYPVLPELLESTARRFDMATAGEAMSRRYEPWALSRSSPSSRMPRRDHQVRGGTHSTHSAAIPIRSTVAITGGQTSKRRSP